MEADYEWDEHKRLANIEKHGIDFYEIVDLFDAPVLRARAKDGVGGEERWIVTGIIRDGLHVSAIYTLRSEVVRVISIRKARRDERRHYEEVFSG
ncbi:putative cytosolic protein (plasmid) [Roseomonas mucosa]|jgi:uncharacterized protein|uniref:BrnT family toxin n=1 Tax=Roseomonas mucosa TaxID=207340 RepID=A0A1S8D0L0_9PROT|nr:BrnT family toxin [Roseomonas mucosa]AWV19960.1 putative cytosolic protein [Roseomonas mucosa]MDT8278775.1 BrnT family toxin [Roseomonas mucosa]MDT8356789.1 BrnT family toxin [Roseomonas mucosa]MDU7521070.1 BrnT family toxin [Roseomonas mucosa]ONH81519.1 hypothetical protein APZ41_019390 [Roseomonas mucosa]